MASPPYNHSLSAMSPPYPSNAQLPPPLKRRQSDMPSSAPSTKRRKASMISNASAPLHPLRQTSFPPENASAQLKYSRSPSMDTMSLVSGVSATKKKRGRPTKNKDNESIGGARAKSTVSGVSGRGKRRASREESVDEDDVETNDIGINIDGTEEERTKEIENRAMLVQGLDKDQMERYESWRSSRLSDAVVRRIVNQTLSQSAPASVILAVKSVAKLFAGEIIEGARKVQGQWNEADEEAAEELKKIEDIYGPVGNGTKELPRGPLTADHLRESLRRYKASREGSSVGQLGLWQLQQSSGVERFGIKTLGKRFMR